MVLNPEIDEYLAEGCGRCLLGGTPDCKVHAWRTELEQLRAIVLDCGLVEERKWGVPCYTVNGGNVLMVSAYKESVVLSFLKGALLRDPNQVLERPGPNSHVARVIRFGAVEEIVQLEPVLRAYIAEAVAAEKQGLKVPKGDRPQMDTPTELQDALDADPALNAAFEALTPGRQRSYLIYISGAKQAATRSNRVAKCTPKIMSGKGWNER